MTSLPIPLHRLHPQALEPTYQTPLAAGMDLHACLEAPVQLLPGARVLIPTGWALALPEGFEAQIRPRSGLALQHGMTVLNSPGTIDPDYRGELKVILVNLGDEPFSIAAGDRIAQLVIAPVSLGAAVEVQDLPESAGRGEGGFGSTGR